MKKVFLSLGANLGDVKGTLQKALELIEKLPGVCDFKYSRFYETSPVTPTPQNNFMNLVTVFKTEMQPLILLQEIKNIEILLGKVPKSKEAPRPIDIDILFYGEEVYNLPELTLPHPRWKDRLFVLYPLLDLTEELSVFDEGAIRKKNIRKMIDNFSDLSQKIRAIQ